MVAPQPQQTAVMLKPGLVLRRIQTLPVELAAFKCKRIVGVRNPRTCCAVGEFAETGEFAPPAFSDGIGQITLKIAEELERCGSRKTPRP